MEQTDEEVLKELGRKIKEARKASKMNQAELAEKVGIDRGYIGMVEKGSVNISFLKLKKINDVLGCDLLNL